jgi:hypothetical protein
MRRRSYALIVAAVFAIALATRTIPLYWSPLPSTLDGFEYVGVARDTISAGVYPYSPELRADFFVVALLTAVASLITGEAPVYTIQPMLSVVGASTVIVGLLLAHRLGHELRWSARRVRVAVLITGGLLSVQGLFLRRTMEPDSEVISILFALLAVVALHRLLLTSDTRWAVPLLLLLGSFPVLHFFGTFNAAVGLTSVFALAIVRRPTRRTLVVGGTAVGGFWLYFILFYETVSRFGILEVGYVSQVKSHPGLFVAWILALVLGAAWYQQATNKIKRGIFLAPLVALFGVVLVNVVQPIYPGTIQSPPAVAGLISLLVVPVVFAGYATPALSVRYDHSVPVLAMIAAPLVIIYFSLTASLTPDFFATGMRAQTFMHVPVFVLVGLGAAGLFHQRAHCSVPWKGIRTMAITALVVCTLLTMPLAFVSLDTVHYPATTTESEFEATGFVSDHVSETWATQHGPNRIAGLYFGNAEGTTAPTREWLVGGAEPACPVLSYESWTTHGAYLWPTQPQTISSEAYESFLTSRNLAYTSSGRDPLAVTIPRTDERNTCEQQQLG